jgi:hypothetical protein
VTDTKPDADGSRVITPADIDALAADGDRQALIDAIYGRGRILHGASLWPVQPVRVRRLWWRWTVVAHPGGKVVAEGHALFERWAWHAAGVAVARLYNKPKAEAS